MRVGLCEESGEVRLWVHDNGPGFDPPPSPPILPAAWADPGLGPTVARTLSVTRENGSVCAVRFQQPEDAADQ